MIDITWLSTVLVGAGFFALGYYIGVHLHVQPLNSGPKVKNALPKNSKKDGTPLTLEVERLADILEDFKMVTSLIRSMKFNVLPPEGRGVLKSEPLAYLMQVLVVRNDLKMGKGKIAAQCSHATLGLYKKLVNRAPKALNRWEMCGQVKVVLKTETEDDMLVLQEKAKSIQLPTHITIDAGRTQIAPNSRTVMAILGPADMVDDVTGGLKLL